MQDQLPILIFAQSARFIAESATHAGHTVWVADCFCDTDTLAVAKRSVLLPPLSTLTLDEALNAIETLSQNQSCQLIIGTGIELFYPLIDKLPAHVHYVDNDFDTLALLHTPQAFFGLLDKFNLPYPTVQFQSPETNSAGWLHKRLTGFGGSHITKAAEAFDRNGGFYQQFVAGQAASACFIANGQKAKLLSINQQITLDKDFQLSQIRTPFSLKPEHQAQLEHIINTITSASKLRGLASLDFILSAEGILILEINPRFSASAELTPYQTQLFQWHLTACQGQLPTLATQTNTQFRLLAYYYAETECRIVSEPEWPATCHDLPAAESGIKQGEPVCSIIITADSEPDCQKKLQQVHTRIRKNFIASD